MVKYLLQVAYELSFMDCSPGASVPFGMVRRLDAETTPSPALILCCIGQVLHRHDRIRTCWYQYPRFIRWYALMD